MMARNAGVSATGCSGSPESPQRLSARSCGNGCTRAGDDPWHLALVQRDRVWNQLQVARLFDSLLAGYPIGTLLLCRIRQPGDVLDHSRSPIAAPAGTWQLVDGQQRISAMVALFADDPVFERYFLDMVGSAGGTKASSRRPKVARRPLLTSSGASPMTRRRPGTSSTDARNCCAWPDSTSGQKRTTAVVANALQQLHDAIVEPVDGERLRQPSGS